MSEATDQNLTCEATVALRDSRESLPTIDPIEAPPVDLKASELYINRELSHLQFNVRVLEQALDEKQPLLERLMFLLIFSSNLDEFFEIRVAEQMRQLKYGREAVGPDAMHPQKVLEKIREICEVNVERQYRILNEIMLPALERGAFISTVVAPGQKNSAPGWRSTSTRSWCR